MFLTKFEMERLTTPRLLAYKAKLMKYRESPNWDDVSYITKSHPAWQEAYKNVKEVLATREHVE